MKHLISRTRKAACTLAAAALALSCWPLSAFAADQISMDAPLAASTGATQTQATYAARDGQLSVTAPVSMTLAASDGTPLDVRHPESWPALTQNLSFQNNSATKLYLSSATVSPAAGAKAIFTGGNLDLALTGTGTSTATAAMPVASTAATGFTMPSDMKTAFALAGSGTATFKLAATLPTANLKSAETLAAAGSLAGATSQLGSLSWTFSYDPTEEYFETDGFYLKVAEKQVGKADGAPDIPASMLGEVFSLAEVKQHSKALADGSASADVQDLYNALVTSMAPKGDYTCYVRYDSEAWPVRIIGLCQDVAAEDFGGYTAGNLVGLTFQFRDLIASSPLKAGSTSSIGGWGGENAQDVRNALNTGGTYYNNMAIKDSIVLVRKYYLPAYNYSGDVSSVPSVPDKMFLASSYELAGGFPEFYNLSQATRCRLQGAGLNHQEQYKFYQNKGISNDWMNFKWLVKGTTRDWAISKVETTSGGNTSTGGITWWERSLDPTTSDSFNAVWAAGYPHGPLWAQESHGVCPCFCL